MVSLLLLLQANLARVIFLLVCRIDAMGSPGLYTGLSFACPNKLYIGIRYIV